MNIKKLTFRSAAFPDSLRNIPTPPKQIYYIGPLLELLQRPRVTIVGSRRVSPYGQAVTRDFARQLAEQGLIIVSGLAFGVDALAHETAIEAGGSAIAVLPSPVDNIMPINNRWLADKVLAAGGALVSEYGSDAEVRKINFVARNRLMSALGDVVLITEAAKITGTKHTFGFAANQGRTVLAVPGNINQPGSAGTNNYLKKGALVATSYKDVLAVLGLKLHKTPARDVKGRNPHEQVLLDLMLQGISEGEALLTQSRLDVSLFNQTMTMLELSNKIHPLGGNYWTIY